MTKNVLVTRLDYPNDAIDELRKRYKVTISDSSGVISKESLMKNVKGVHGLFCVSTDIIDSDVLNAAGPQLEIISTMSVGYDNIDVKECKKRNIIVTNVPHLSTEYVAEYTVGLLIAVGRKIVEASTAITKGKWVEKWNPNFFCGVGLKNATVGIVGMGKIGQAVLKRILSFDTAKVIYYDIVHPIFEAEKLGAYYLPFDKLLQESDFVVVNCNLSDETRNMFNAQAFNLMKPSAIFINTSRGGVVQQDDLYDALKNGKIKAAGLDVMTPEPLPPDHKLTTLSNLVLSPHIASAERSVHIEQANWNAKNIISVLEGEPPLSPV